MEKPWNHPDSSVRLAAVQRAASEKQLVKIAKTCRYKDACLAAAAGVQSEKALIAIAEAAREYASPAALKRIANQDYLIRYARQKAGHPYRETAIALIENTHVLEELLADSGESYFIKMAVLQKLGRRAEAFALSASQQNLIELERTLAAQNDDLLLAEAACLLLDDAKAELTIGHLIAQDSIAHVAMMATQPSRRLQAVNLLQSGTLLEQVYLHEDDPEIRTAALARMKAPRRERLLASRRGAEEPGVIPP